MRRIKCVGHHVYGEHVGCGKEIVVRTRTQLRCKECAYLQVLERNRIQRPPKFGRLYEKFSCEGCEKETVRTGRGQKFCKDCRKKHKLEWQRKNRGLKFVSTEHRTDHYVYFYSDEFGIFYIGRGVDDRIYGEHSYEVEKRCALAYFRGTLRREIVFAGLSLEGSRERERMSVEFYSQYYDLLNVHYNRKAG